jgi:hypothetical protein
MALRPYVVQSAIAGAGPFGASTVSCTFTNSVKAGNVIFVVGNNYAEFNSVVFSFADNQSNTYTEIATARGGSPSPFSIPFSYCGLQDAWLTTASASGSLTVTLTSSLAAKGSLLLCIVEVSGLIQNCSNMISQPGFDPYPVAFAPLQVPYGAGVILGVVTAQNKFVPPWTEYFIDAGPGYGLLNQINVSDSGGTGFGCTLGVISRGSPSPGAVTPTVSVGPFGPPENWTASTFVLGPSLPPDWLIVQEPLGIVDQSARLYLGDGANHSFTLQSRQRGSADYTLIVRAGDAYEPTTGQPIWLWDQNKAGFINVFSGFIQDFKNRQIGLNGDRYIDCTATSLESVFDTVYATPLQFVDKTCGEIVTALYNAFDVGAQVDLGPNISDGVTLPLFNTNYEKLSDLFTQLATTSGFVWGVDPYTQNLYFCLPSTVAAPLTLTSGNAQWDSISWEYDAADYRNRQAMRLSYDAFTHSAEFFVGAGQTSFTLLRPVEQVTNAYITLSTPNIAFGQFGANAIAGDTITMGPAAGAWQASHIYALNGVIVVSGFVQKVTTAGTSGSGFPAFSTVTGATTTDNTVIWTCQGLLGLATGVDTYTFVLAAPEIPWAPNTFYLLHAQILVEIGGAQIAQRATSIVAAAVWSAVTGYTLGTQIFDSGTGTVQEAKTTGVSGGSAPSFSGVTGHTTTDNTVTWECLGPNGGSGLTYPSFSATAGAMVLDGSVTWTSLGPCMDNRQFGQVAIGATAAITCQHLADAINSNAAVRGQTFSLPTWENSNGNAINVSGATFEFEEKGAGTSYITDLSSSSAAGAWTATHAYALGYSIQVTIAAKAYLQTVTTAGTSGSSTPTFSSVTGHTVTDGSVVWTCEGLLFGWFSGGSPNVAVTQTQGGTSPQGSVGPNQGATISIQVYAVGTNTAAPSLSYTQGSRVVNLATPLNPGTNLNVEYTRPDGNVIEVEDTAKVLALAVQTYGTGKVQQISDQSSTGLVSTDAASGLILAQQALAAYSTVPLAIEVQLLQGGILPGQEVTIALSGFMSIINATYFVEEVRGELIPTWPYLDNPVECPGAGHYRYSLKLINISQIASYMDFWEGFGGGGSGSGGGGGGAGSSLVATSGGIQSTAGTALTVGGAEVKTASYAAKSTDYGQLLVFNSATSITLTLPTLPFVPPFLQWWIEVQNIGAGILTINRNGLLIDGVAANLTRGKNGGVIITSDGTNFFTERGGPLIRTNGTVNLDQGTLDLTPGIGITVVESSPGIVTISATTTAVTKVAAGSVTLGTAAISAGAAAATVTMAATGTLVGDLVVMSFEADPTGIAGYTPGAMLSIIGYPTNGFVNFIVVNNTGSTITPGALTINWIVER